MVAPADPNGLIARIEAGAAAAKEKRITRVVEYGGARITLALPHPSTLRRLADEALPAIRKTLMAELAPSADEDTDSEGTLRLLRRIDAEAAELAFRAACAEFVLDIRDAASPDGGPSMIRHGWLVALGLPLAGYDESMEGELSPFEPSIVPVILGHSPVFARFVARELSRHDKFFNQAKEAESKNSGSSRGTTPEEGSPAASASKSSSAKPGRSTSSSKPKAAARRRKSSKNA